MPRPTDWHSVADEPAKTTEKSNEPVPEHRREDAAHARHLDPGCSRDLQIHRDRCDHRARLSPFRHRVKDETRFGASDRLACDR